MLAFSPSHLLLQYTANGKTPSRMGNRDPDAAPHGAYPCKGEDRWCVVAVLDDKEWRSFCQVLGKSEWIEDQRFATLLGRKENEDELNKLIAAWTIEHSAEEIMELLQRTGVSAAVVQTIQDLLDRDPQLLQQGIFPMIEHREMGLALHYGFPIQLSEAPWKLRAAPCLGEHTELICREILGMTDEEFAGLVSAGVLY